MMNIFAKPTLATLATAFILAAAAPAKAESSFEYQGGKKAYDRKIEQAAIKRVAEKIGDLRGSLEGFEHGYIVLESELDGPKSSSLGFPIINERMPSRDITTGSVQVM